MVAAVTAAVAACAAETGGATCYFCLDDGECEGLVRGCACRGTSGFAHISCLARQANTTSGQKLGSDKLLRWISCGLCEQEYHGPVSLALTRACASTYASRSSCDEIRFAAQRAVANQLSGHEAVTFCEQMLSDVQQNSFVGKASLIDVNEKLATAYGNVGRYDDALALWQEVHARNAALRGSEDEETLFCAGVEAHCLVATGRYDEAKTLLRDTVMPVARRVLPPESDVVISGTVTLARALYQANGASVENMLEAEAMLEAMCQTTRRIFGAGNPNVTNRLAYLDRVRAELTAAADAAADAAALAAASHMRRNRVCTLYSGLDSQPTRKS